MLPTSVELRNVQVRTKAAYFLNKKGNLVRIDLSKLTEEVVSTSTFKYVLLKEKTDDVILLTRYGNEIRYKGFDFRPWDFDNQFLDVTCMVQVDENLIVARDNFTYNSEVPICNLLKLVSFDGLFPAPECQIVQIPCPKHQESKPRLTPKERALSNS